MIIYLHGFASSGFGHKAQLVRAWFNEHHVRCIAPSLPQIPELAIHTLYDLIESLLPYEPVHLIGSSLGGYYSLHLAERYRLRSVLINPSVNPIVTLGEHTGYTTHFHDGSQFEWTADHSRFLARLATTPSENLQANCLLLVQTGDETLDYREAVHALPHAEQVVEPGGDHGFQGIERHLPKIKQFLSVTWR